MHAIAHVLAFIAGAAFLLIGGFALAFPARLARDYGLPTSERAALAFVRATGARDIALGIILWAAVLSGNVPLLRVIAASGCIVALVDFAIAYAGADRTIQPQHATHLAGATAFGIILIFLI